MNSFDIFTIDSQGNTQFVKNLPPTGGFDWQLADFGDVWVLTNGAQTEARLNGEVNPTHRLGTVCARRARLIYGDMDGKPNVVGWSTLGGETIPNILLGTPVPAHLAALNQHGIAPMPFAGKVLRLGLLGDDVVVYGEDGIAVLRTLGGGFGVHRIDGLPDDLGLYARGAVGIADGAHLFRGTDGELWMVLPDLRAERLGFGWTLGECDTIAYNGARHEFWVGDGTDSFVLTRHGLGGPIQQTLTSVAGPHMTGAGYPQNPELLLHTNTIDIHQNAQKRISLVNLNGDFGAGRVGALIRFDTHSDWREREPVRLTPEGAAWMLTNMVYGQLKIEAACAPGDRMTRCEVRYQSHDRRFIRGTRSLQHDEDDDPGAA